MQWVGGRTSALDLMGAAGDAPKWAAPGGPVEGFPRQFAQCGHHSRFIHSSRPQVGMRYFHKTMNKFHCPVVNLDKIWSLVGGDAAVTEAQAKAGQARVIDVTKHGFFKVLGKGGLPKVPVVVKAKFFSKLAEQRIKEAGGACVLVA